MPTIEARPSLRLSGVVLAAGSAARMGRPKQLLRFGDRPLLQCVVDAALASCLEEVVVVLGDRAEEIRSALTLPTAGRVRTVSNPAFAAGQSGSLGCGLRAVDAGADAVAVLLGDQPTVTPALIDRVATAFQSAAAAAARPVYPDAGGVPGHPVLLARRIWPQALALQGDRGARSLFDAHPDWLLAVPVAGDPPIDVNTPDDYERAQRGQTVLDTDLPVA